MSIVVPQAIGISLRNRIGDSTGDVPCFYLGVCGHNGLDIIALLLVSLCFYFSFIVCLCIDTPRYWFGLDLLFTTTFSVYAGLWPKVAYIRRFLAKIHLYMQVFGPNPHIHATFWPKVAHILNYSLNSHVHPPFR